MSLKYIPISIIILFHCTSIATSAIIGVELGNDYIRAVFSKTNSSFTLLPDDEGNTKISTAISMINNERLFGEEALEKQHKFPQNVLNNLLTFLGKKYQPEAISKFLDIFFVSYELVESQHRGSVDVKISYNKENLQLSMEDVYAMLFRYLKATADKFVGADVKECVVTVPNYFGYLERLSIIQSIGLSNLFLVAMVSDNAAASVEFQQKKAFEKPENYIFYHMGATASQATLVTYKTKWKNNNTDDVENDVTVTGEAWDENLGVANFKYNFVKYLASKIDMEESRKELPKISNNKEALLKLVPCATMYIERLSSEKEVAIEISENECGVKYIGKITTEEFVEINKEELKGIYAPIEKLLKNTEMKLSNITKIELIGDSVKIPGIQESLKEKLLDVSSLLDIPSNSDTIVAFGAARICANYTTKYYGSKKPKVVLNNGVNYKFKVNVQNLLKNNETRSECIKNENQTNLINESCYQKINQNITLFNVRHGYILHRTVSVRIDTDLIMVVHQQMEGESDENARPLVFANVVGIEDMLKEMKNNNVATFPKVNMKFHLDYRGLLSCNAELVYELLLYLGQMTGPNGGNEVVFSINYTDPLPKEEIEKIDHDLQNAVSLNLTEGQQMILKMKREIGKKQVREEKKALQISVKFPEPLPLFGEDMAKKRERLEKLDKVDKERELSNEKLKIMSILIRAKKEWLDSKSSGKYGIESEIQETTKKMAELTEWFEKEAQLADLKTLEEKLNLLHSYFSVYDNRKKIYKEREKSFEKFNSEMKWAYNEGEKVLQKKPWVEEHYKSFFMKKMQELEKWFNEIKDQQGSLKLTEAAIITADQVQEKLTTIKAEVSTLTNIPMPNSWNETLGNDAIKTDL